jgi:erythronate-4-phosphate dehydrogenase
VPAGASGGEELLRSIVNDCYDIARDDQRLRGIVAVPQTERGTYFRQLRTHYPLRREFSATTVVLPREHAGLTATLRDLGFAVMHGEGKNR